MTTTFAALLAPTVQASPADTVVTVVARSGLEVAADVALLALTVVLALLVLVLLVQLRKVHGTVRSLGDTLLDKADPAIQSARGVGENVEFITGVLREDIQRVHRLVRETTERLNRASDRMEERIEEFNALMEVVQEEAEDIFVGTASTVRGVREGARTLSRPEDGETAGRRGGGGHGSEPRSPGPAEPGAAGAPAASPAADAPPEGEEA